MEHWNGSWWTTVQLPGQGSSTALFGIAASSAGNGWAVGEQADPADPANMHAFALHCC